MMYKMFKIVKNTDITRALGKCDVQEWKPASYLSVQIGSAPATEILFLLFAQ